MGKRELAQIIAAQEWHDPSKWERKRRGVVVKKESERGGAREEQEENKAADVAAAAKSTKTKLAKREIAPKKKKNVGKNTTTTTTTTTTARRRRREEEEEEKGGGGAQEVKKSTETKKAKKSAATTVAAATEKKKPNGKEVEEDSGVSPPSSSTRVVAARFGEEANDEEATGKFSDLSSKEEEDEEKKAEETAKKREKTEEENGKEKDPGARREAETKVSTGVVAVAVATTTPTSAKDKEEQEDVAAAVATKDADAAPPRAMKTKAIKSEEGKDCDPLNPSSPARKLEEDDNADERKAEEPLVSLPARETSALKVSPPVPSLVKQVEGGQEPQTLKPMPMCFYCKTYAHCVNTTTPLSLTDCNAFAEDVNTKPMNAIKLRFAEGTKERLAVEQALMKELSSCGGTKSKDEKLMHGTVTGAKECEIEQKMVPLPSTNHPPAAGVVIEDAAVANKQLEQPTAGKQSYMEKLQEIKRIQQMTQNNEELGLFDAAATLSSFSNGVKKPVGVKNKSSGSGGSIGRKKNPSPSAAAGDNAAVSKEDKVEHTKTGKAQKAKKQGLNAILGTAAERKKKHKEGIENFLRLATIRAHMKEPDEPKYIHREASLRTKVEPDSLTLFSGGKWRLVQGEEMAQAEKAAQDKSSKQPSDENTSYEEALRRIKAAKEAKMLESRKIRTESEEGEGDEETNALRENANPAAEDLEKQVIQMADANAAVETKEDGTSKNPLEELAKVRKVTDTLKPGTKTVTIPTREDRLQLQTMISSETKTTTSSGKASKYSTEGLKFQRIEPPPDYETPILKPKRKRFANNPSFGITRAMIEQRFHMPLREAAKELKVGRTTFKRVLRLHGIERWPSQSLNAKQLTMKTITSLMSLPMARMEKNLMAQTLDSPNMNTSKADEERDEEQKKQMESLSNGIFAKNTNRSEGGLFSTEGGLPRVPNIALGNNNIMNSVLNGKTGVSPEHSKLFSYGGMVGASLGNKSLKTSDLRGMSDLPKFDANVNAMADNATLGSLRLSDNTFGTLARNRAFSEYNSDRDDEQKKSKEVASARKTTGDKKMKATEDSDNVTNSPIMDNKTENINENTADEGKDGSASNKDAGGEEKEQNHIVTLADIRPTGASSEGRNDRNDNNNNNNNKSTMIAAEKKEHENA